MPRETGAAFLPADCTDSSAPRRRLEHVYRGLVVDSGPSFHLPVQHACPAAGNYGSSHAHDDGPVRAGRAGGLRGSAEHRLLLVLRSSGAVLVDGGGVLLAPPAGESSLEQTARAICNFLLGTASIRLSGKTDESWRFDARNLCVHYISILHAAAMQLAGDLSPWNFTKSLYSIGACSRLGTVCSVFPVLAPQPFWVPLRLGKVVQQ